MQSDQAREIDGLVKKIWETEIKKDYDDCRILEESVLRSAFYYHLRERVKNRKTLKDLVLYPEMRVKPSKGENLRIDLAVVEMECDDKNMKTSKDCERKWKDSGSCITKLLAAFEFKHWDKFKRDQGYGRAVRKDLKKLKKCSEGICYRDDKLKRPLKTQRTYLGILLEEGPMPTRESIIGKRGEYRNVCLLLGVDLGKKSEFRYMGPSEDE